MKEQTEEIDAQDIDEQYSKVMDELESYEEKIFMKDERRSCYYQPRKRSRHIESG